MAGAREVLAASCPSCANTAAARQIDSITTTKTTNFFIQNLPGDLKPEKMPV
jgi:hypothetical protein